MPVYLRPNELYVKNPNGSGYLPQNVISETSTAEMLAAFDETIANTQESLDTITAAAQSAVDGIESQKNTMIASIASVAGQGTDTTLSQSGVAADAKAVGDGISNLDSAMKYKYAEVAKTTSGDANVTIKLLAGKKYFAVANGASFLGFNSTNQQLFSVSRDNGQIITFENDVTVKRVYSNTPKIPTATLTIYNLDVLYVAEGDYVVPEMFGAVGNGVNDDTSALQSAINSGRPIRITYGTYKITTPLEIKSGCSIIGCSSTYSKIESESNINIFTGYNVENCKIENLRLVKKSGDKWHIDVEAGRLITVNNCQFAITSTIGDTHTNGLRYRSDTQENGYDAFINTVSNCAFFRGTVDIGTTDSYVLNNCIWANSLNGYALEIRTSSIFVRGNQIVGGKSGGCIIRSANEVVLLHNFIDGSYNNINTGDGIRVNGGWGNIISHCWIYNQSKSGVVLRNANNVKVNDNIFNNNNKGLIVDGVRDDNIYGTADIYIDCENYSYYGEIIGNIFYNTRQRREHTYHAMYKTATTQAQNDSIVRYFVDRNRITLDSGGYNTGNFLGYCFLNETFVFGTNVARWYTFFNRGNNSIVTKFDSRDSSGSYYAKIVDNNAGTINLNDGSAISVACDLLTGINPDTGEPIYELGAVNFTLVKIHNTWNLKTQDDVFGRLVRVRITAALN